MKQKTAQQLVNEVCQEIKLKEQKRFNQGDKFWKDFYSHLDKELQLEFKK